MSDYLSNLNSRAAFLAMKARMSGLTPEEAAEWERIKVMRVRQNPDGTIWVEAPPMTVEDWKAHVRQVRGTPAKLVANAGVDKRET